MIGALVFLVGLGALGYVVVRAARSGETGSGGSRGTAVRRFFQYLLLFGLLVVAAVGLAGLLARAVETGTVAERGEVDLARSLAFTVVGLPLFAATAVWSARRLRSDPGEARSLGWAFYATVAPITALAVTMTAAHDVLTWAFGLDRYDAAALAQLVVWGGAWAGHWWAVGRYVPRGDGQVHLIAGSLIGLGAAATGLGSLLSAALELLYDALTDVGLVGTGEQPLLGPAATIIVGGSVWVWYWVVHAARSRRTSLWHGYVLLAGVGGGLATAVISLSVLLYDVAVWLVGEPDAGTAAAHFDDVPGLLAGLAVGVVVWWYHRVALRSAEVGARSDIDRIYEYLVAAVGLLAAAGGLTTVLVAIAEALTTGAAVEVDTAPINTLLAALTLLVVGGPVWWVFWRRIERAVEADPVEEIDSTVRRVYLFVLFGVGGVVAVATLLIAMFIGFEDVLEGQFGSETLRRTRFALGILLTTGGVAAYHWVVYRSDRERAGPEAGRGPSFVLLVGRPDDETARAVGRATGARVRHWERTDAVTAWDREALVEALTELPDDEVMVVAGPDGFEVVPIER